jgi:GDP-4-dehydro-6-deoxy-D-mannose reductase
LSRVLITGCDGFVGRTLTARMNDAGYEVWGVDRFPHDGMFAGHTHFVNDLSDAGEVGALVAKAEPDAIVHLAAQASVHQSFDEPRETLVSNVVPVLNLLDALRSGKPGIRLLAIGSAEEYGKVAPEALPLTETAPLDPESPYALGKSIQNQCCRAFASLYGVDVVMTRSFNHTGPGQRDAFVLSGFARQITEIRMGTREPVIEVGNLSARRDFTDVRDVCDAYVALIEKGRAGEVYNVCSGESHNVGDLLERMCELGGCDVEIRVDPDRMRPVDVPDLRGDHGKITRETGWKPAIPTEDTLQALLDYWSTRLKQ